jgi:hypothetical protein
MNTHPYLRAFLAGIFVPTLALPLILTGFIIVRLVLEFPVPIERAIVFPMAVVPALWGLWNMLWLGAHGRTHLPVGVHGAILPVLLAPTGLAIGSWLRILALHADGVMWLHAVLVPYTLLAPFLCAVLAGYYLVWKYIIGTVNRVLGIA